ncbi:hypothetical protein [Parasitella parasitica]|uniref:Cytochrome P450 n=1 Tax=Parasitella parasitica TaxID=35722 RepID=A0A0B7N355_9FUNG|nr:hypothetical protein [Parasitella parasitica]
MPDTSLLPMLMKKGYMVPAIGVATAAAIVYSASSVNKSKQNQAVKEIPTPSSCYPYIGHMLALSTAPGKQLVEWHKELGPIIKIHMGKQIWILVDDPELAHKIFVSHGAETSFRPYSTYASEHYSFRGKCLVGPYIAIGSLYPIVISILAPKQIDTYMDSIDRESFELANRLISATEAQGSVDPMQHFMMQALNVIYKVCFGARFDSIDDPEFIELSELIERTMSLGALENDLASFLPILSFIDYFAGSQVKMKRFIKNKRDPVFKRLIKEALQREGPNIVKSLNDPKYDFNEEEKIVLLCDIIAGGTETTATSLSWNFAILSHYPEIQERAIQEIDNFIKIHGRVPQFHERLEVPYCIAIIKESMRYRPPSPFGLPHSVQEDGKFLIENFVIPKGAMLISSMDSMHQKPQNFSNPELYEPDRFLSNLKTMHASANGKLTERDHFTFGWGRRICPGIYLAEAEIFNALVQVLSRCKIEADDALGLPDIDHVRSGSITAMTLPYKLKFAKRVNCIPGSDQPYW